MRSITLYIYFYSSYTDWWQKKWLGVFFKHQMWLRKPFILIQRFECHKPCTFSNAIVSISHTSACFISLCFFYFYILNIDIIQNVKDILTSYQIRKIRHNTYEKNVNQWQCSAQFPLINVNLCGKVQVSVDGSVSHATVDSTLWAGNYISTLPMYC